MPLPLRVTSVLVLAVIAISAHAAQPCAPGDSARTALPPLGLQYKLLAHKIPPDEFELEAPADVSRDVIMLRKTLDIATQDFFRCDAGEETSPASLEVTLSRFLHSGESARKISHDRQDGIYGANLKVHIEPAKDLASSVFVVLTFDIECGDDNLLFLYNRNDGAWRKSLAWYSSSYNKPSDAFGGVFSYGSVPGPNSDASLVAVVHGRPWCTSVHSGFGVDLIQPSAAAVPQKNLDHLDHSYVIDDQFDFKPTRMAL